MEFLISIIIIIVLLFIWGVSIHTMFLIAEWGMMLFISVMGIYYIINLIIWLLGKSCKGNFIRVEKMGALHFAVVYQVDSAEYKNYFLMETRHGHSFDTKKIYKLRILQIGRISLAIDSYCLKESIIMLLRACFTLVLLIRQII